MKWCMQCAEENQPRPAVGLDEEGEAACIAHTVQNVTEKPVRPSVVIQPETSTPMNDVNRAGRNCPGYGSREGTCETIIGPRKELCTKCYANRHYHQSSAEAPKKITPKRPQKLPATEPPTATTAADLAALKADLLAKLAAVEAVERMLSH